MDLGNKQKIQLIIDDIKNRIELGKEIPIEYKNYLFPNDKKECELTYSGKKLQSKLFQKL